MKLIAENDKSVTVQTDIEILKQEQMSKDAKCKFASEQASKILLKLLDSKLSSIKTATSVEQIQTNPLDDLEKKFTKMVEVESKCDCLEGEYTIIRYKVKGSDSGEFFMTFNDKGTFDTKGEIAF